MLQAVAGGRGGNRAQRAQLTRALAQNVFFHYYRWGKQMVMELVLPRAHTAQVRMWRAEKQRAASYKQW